MVLILESYHKSVKYDRPGERMSSSDSSELWIVIFFPYSPNLSQLPVLLLTTYGEIKSWSLKLEA